MTGTVPLTQAKRQGDFQKIVQKSYKLLAKKAILNLCVTIIEEKASHIFLVLLIRH